MQVEERDGLEETMRRQLAIIGTALVATAVVPAPADGDGLPVGGVEAGPAGVTNAAAADRYVTLYAGRDTVVARIRRAGGQVLRSRVLHGAFTIPAVALDATPGGLAADGRTLVLIRPRPGFPQARTRLVVLHARSLAPRRRITLAGDFSFDAISPDGATLYLIQYTSRRDPTRYAVRAYDIAGGRLERAPIVDKREPGEQMRGYPLTRLTTSDGRWAYTLYDGGGREPFIHALDTREGEAACIDLDGLPPNTDLVALDLTLDGPDLTVRDAGGPVAIVDRATFRVSSPVAGVRRPGRAPVRGDDGGAPWTLIATGAAALLLVAGAAGASGRRRRRDSVAPLRESDADPELVMHSDLD
jgi:hypothetical protein